MLHGIIQRFFSLIGSFLVIFFYKINIIFIEIDIQKKHDILLYKIKRLKDIKHLKYFLLSVLLIFLIPMGCEDTKEKKDDASIDSSFISLGYGKYELNQIVENLYEQLWADDESLIYLESNECLDKLVSPKYQLIRDSKAGNVYYGILKLTTPYSKK